MWFAEHAGPPDEDLRVLALGGLLKLEGEKAVPILGQIAFESEQPGPAIRAVSMLAQSPLPQAREAVVAVAKRAATPEPVRLAAVRDLGRFGGPDASKELLSLYTIVNEPVKLQIVKSLGERAEAGALVRIVETEKDGVLRFSALAGLGEAGGVSQLVKLYRSASPQGKRSIVIGLFRARADGELIQIANSETDPQLRTFTLERLRLLGTPQARDYLQKPGEKR
jgi:HEAT repeat protein